MCHLWLSVSHAVTHTRQPLYICIGAETHSDRFNNQTKALDGGTIQELDCPFTLLQNKGGALYKMVQQMGPS